ncbi:MAG TPA: ATP-binding protein, partial [Salinibacter sp.]|nr:ATP-binding protein [Salinibacter sp.]
VQEYERVQRRLWSVNEALQAQNQLLNERTDQVKSLSKALTQAEEKERKRLSHVLHDDLQQVLYAVRTKLDLVADEEMSEERVQSLLGRALEMIDDGIDITRTLATDLNPPVECSLWNTLEWLAIRMQETHGLSVELRASGEDRSIDKGLRVLVVRLVRELLFNVVKHAETNEATLFLRESDDQLYIVVEDQGVGFDPDDVEGDGGFGLASVSNRITLVGGTFEVDAAPGQGTRVVLGVPYQLGLTGERDQEGIGGCAGLEQGLS